MVESRETLNFVEKDRDFIYDYDEISIFGFSQKHKQREKLFFSSFLSFSLVPLCK